MVRDCLLNNTGYCFFFVCFGEVHDWCVECQKVRYRYTALKSLSSTTGLKAWPGKIVRERANYIQPKIIRGVALSRTFNFPETKNFQKNFREFWEISGISKSSGFPGLGKFFFLEIHDLPIFLILSISGLIFSILLCCFDKLSLSFLISSTN